MFSEKEYKLYIQGPEPGKRAQTEVLIFASRIRPPAHSGMLLLQDAELSIGIPLNARAQV